MPGPISQEVSRLPQTTPDLHPALAIRSNTRTRKVKFRLSQQARQLRSLGRAGRPAPQSYPSSFHSRNSSPAA
jgi:hypothetical protein